MRTKRNEHVWRQVAVAAALAVALCGVVRPAHAATEAQKTQAIARGLAYLASVQNPDGSFPGAYGYPIASTAASMLAFEEQYYRQGNTWSPGPDYSAVVSQAAAYVLSQTQATSLATANWWGFTGTQADHLGYYWAAGYNTEEVYQTGLVIPALSRLTDGINGVTPGTVISSTNSLVNGRTYREVIQRSVDLLAWGQNGPGSFADGGWRYVVPSPDDADNSTSQWPAIGMFFAQAVPGVVIPDLTRLEMITWINTIQAPDGGSYYQPGSLENESKTGGMLVEMAFARGGGNQATALAYLNQEWQNGPHNEPWDGNFGHPYAMWSIYKGLEATIGIDDATWITNLHTNPGDVDNPHHGWNWWEDYCHYLVNNQNPDGSWSGYSYWDAGLATPWYLNILHATNVNSKPLASWTSRVNATTPWGGSTWLTFGVIRGATTEVDTVLGEGELPPLPPWPAFDARWRQGTAVDYHPTEADTLGSSWLLDIQAESRDLPVTVTWDRSLFPAGGTFTLSGQAPTGTVSVDMLAQTQWQLTAEGQALLVIHYTPAAQIEHSYSLSPGWSMVSLPVLVRDPRGVALFPSLRSLFGFDTQYEPASTMFPGTGYWVNLGQSETPTATGRAYPSASLVRSLPARWSMVGPGHVTLDVAALKTAFPAIVSVYAYSGGYHLATTLQPGKGYWINMAYPAAVDLSGSVGTPQKPVATDAGTTPQPTFWAAGGGQTQALDLGVAQAQVLELPPVPPAGVFDVRADVRPGTQAWQIPDVAGSYALHLQGGVEHLEWDLPADNPWELTVDGQTLPLVGRGQVAVGDGATVTVTRTVALPQATVLLGPSPNPFNPTTTLRYALATAADVRLCVYAANGQRIRELVAGRQEAGHYSLSWDGRDATGATVGAGVYLCELRAGSYRAVQRMALIK